jgi:hypothetical protein
MYYNNPNAALKPLIQGNKTSLLRNLSTITTANKFFRNSSGFKLNPVFISFFQAWAQVVLLQ